MASSDNEDIAEAAFQAALKGIEDAGLSEIDQAAIAASEVYKAYERAAFTPRQSLYLTQSFLTQNPGPAPPPA